ncbi:MAG: hypothetical protein QOG87_640 [Actinomycetota bacterium]|jgi:hypothetical protein
MTQGDVLDARVTGDTTQTRRLLAIAVAAGVAFEIGLRGGSTNVIVVAGIVVVVVALLQHGRVERREAQWVLAASLAPALFLAVRSSPWLAASNCIAIVAMLTAALAHGRSGSILDTTPTRLLRRAIRMTLGSLQTLGVLRPLLVGRSTPPSGRITRVFWAALVAAPPLAIVVALLASADAVFARLLVPDVHAGPITGHVVLAALCALLVLGLVAGARADGGHRPVPPGAFGSVEVATMLGLAAAVVGLFALSQLIALTGAGRRLVESSGLTPSEYARSGFFQLCWATAVLVAFLAVVRALAAPGVLALPIVRRLAAAVPLLALGLVAVSLRRMDVYDDAFGLTMLRLWVIGAAVWMGALLVMLALRNSGVGGDRDWVVGGAGAVAVALVLVANLVNPEAYVVHHNVNRAIHRAVPLDVAYLVELSDDAVPALVDAGIAPNCRDKTGVAALNVSARRASPFCAANPAP